MVTPLPTETKDETKLYPETLYSAKRVSLPGGQPVYKKLLPDGESTELSPGPSQKLRLHSPDGFQWGYNGSGPSQLSLALLLDATTDPETAQAYYQQFKWDVVAGWGDEWSILRGEILLWIEQEKLKQLEALISKN